MYVLIEPFRQLFFDNKISLDVLFFSILIILLPAALITGPAIPDILLSFVALYFLIISVFKKKWNYYKHPVVWGFFAFSFYGILRSIFSEMPFESLTNEGSLFYFRYIFFALGLWYLLDLNPYLSKCLLYVSILCIFVVTVDGMYQYFMSENLFGNKKWNSIRLTGLFGDEPILGRYVAYLSIFSFGLIYQNFALSKNMMIWSVAFLVLAEVIVFLSGERSPFFYLGLFSFFILVFIPHYRLYRLIGILVSVVIIFGIIKLNPVAKQRMVDETLSQMSETQLPLLPYSELHERHYVVALKMFKSNPIFGLGTNTFRYQCEKEKYYYKSASCTTHPHNFYIQVLAELGLIGFLFIFSFFFYLFLVILKQLYHIYRGKFDRLISFEKFLFLLVIFVYWWPLIPHMSLYNNWNNVLMMLPLGYLLKILKR